MKRLDSLPNEFTTWIRALPTVDLRRRLSDAIDRQAICFGLSFDAGTIVAAIEGFDQQYFSLLEDAGTENDALRFFRQARLASAYKFLLEHEEEESAYEFFMSLREDTTHSAIRELSDRKQTIRWSQLR